MITSLNSASPFASFIVAQIHTPNTKLSDITDNIINTLEPPTGWQGKAQPNLPQSARHTEESAYHLIENRLTSWAGRNTITDTLNHLVAVFKSGSFVAIYVSDSDLKARLHESLSLGSLSNINQVDEAVLIKAFVHGNKLRTLWLGGTHRNVSVKPNSKILSGESLGDAIDPFGDNTFITGAVRSSTAGVSLKRSGVWFGPKKNWTDFSLAADHLLKELNAAHATAPNDTIIHAGLATSAADFKKVGKAYLIEWTDPETIKGARLSKKIDSLRTSYEMEISTTQPKPIDVNVEVTCKKTGLKHCFTIKPDIKNRKVFFKTSSNKAAACFSEWINAVELDAEVLRLLYEDGHSIVYATLCLPATVDRKFDIEFLDFSPAGFNYDVTQEKPPGSPPPLHKIYDNSDKSLFKWIAKDGLSQMGLAQPSPGSCWLYCDDRSMEVADFIHVHKPASGTPTIAIIHAKGANSASSNRKISPGAYELVTAQAIKNLKRISSNSIINDIANTLRSSKDRVWDLPWSPNLQSSTNAKSDLEAALKAIKQDCDYQVLIVQLHALKSKLNTGSKLNIGARQLHTLLLGAESLAHSVSAKFRVISDKR